MSKFQEGDKVRYLGTKEGSSGASWNEYFGSKGVSAGDECVIQSVRDNDGSDSYFVKDKIRDNTCGYLRDEDLELVNEPKFKIGDTVRCVPGETKGAGWKLNREFLITKISNGYCSTGAIYWDKTSGQGVYEDSLELISSINYSKQFAQDSDLSIGEKLIEQHMEIKDMKKSILAEANKEVLEELENEQKEIAKRELRNLYNLKNSYEKDAKLANERLNEILKSLEVVKAKKN